MKGAFESAKMLSIAWKQAYWDDSITPPQSDPKVTVNGMIPDFKPLADWNSRLIYGFRVILKTLHIAIFATLLSRMIDK